MTPCTAARQACLSITNSQGLHKLMSIELVMPSSHLILCRPLLLLPPMPPSIRVFSNESTFCMRWPKYWSFSFSISPYKEHPGLISFRMDWLDLLTVQGTLKSLLQHHSSKTSILRCSSFFIVQLSHPYMTTGKNIALTRWLIFLPGILILAFDSSSLAFLVMYSAYKLNKQGDNIQPWHTPFPILNQSVVPYPVLTVASCPAYRLLRRQVRWSGIFFFLRIFHGLLWSTQSNTLACCKTYLCNLIYTICLHFFSSSPLLYFPSPPLLLPTGNR